MISFADSYFHISSKSSSYIMQILPDGTLRHCYYGRNITNENMDFYNLYTSYTYTVSFKTDNQVTTMDALPQEFSSCGRSDYRSPSAVIEGENGIRASEFKYLSHSIYSGAVSLKGLPCLDTDADTAQTLEIVLRDIISGVDVHLFYTVFEDIDIIARHTEIVNTSKSAVKLDSIMSFSIDFEAADFELVSLYGNWGNERSAERYRLHHGKTTVSSNKGASGHHSCPFAALVKNNTDEENGEAYGVSLVYSGNFEIGAEIGQFNTTRFFAGINSQGFLWQIEAGESFVTPQAVLTYSCEGLGKMSRNFHSACRRHLGACVRHKKHPVVWNLWEAFYFDVNEQRVLETIDAVKDFGIDVMVLDDGWFGKRQSDETSLGDWYINTEKFPVGFERIIERCKANNLKFGLWFEPEVISPQSELYKNHPDWCIHIGGVNPLLSRNELVLDFSRQEVIDAIYERMSAILRKYDISYVKWDMNRNFSDIGSAVLSNQRQSELPHRYILGVYSLMSRITKEFPDVFFEGSAGGGGRFDYGILYYMSQIWTSDNSDAIARLTIQSNTSLAFPPEAISCHVSECPNHQTGRTTPFKTRGDVAQLFSFGYELNPARLTKEQAEQLKSQVLKHKQFSKWLTDAEFYRLKAFDGADNCAWQSVSKDKRYSAVFYATGLTKPEKTGEYLRLKGLDTSKKYRVLPNDIVVSGDVLMYAGLPIKQQYQDFTSVLFEITQV